MSSLLRSEAIEKSKQQSLFGGMGDERGWNQHLVEAGKARGSQDPTSDPSHRPCYEMNRAKAAAQMVLGAKGHQSGQRRSGSISSPGHRATNISDFTQNHRKD